jgi:hypothetical protein
MHYYFVCEEDDCDNLGLMYWNSQLGYSHQLRARTSIASSLVYSGLNLVLRIRGIDSGEVTVWRLESYMKFCAQGENVVLIGCLDGEVRVAL